VTFGAISGHQSAIGPEQSWRSTTRENDHAAAAARSGRRRRRALRFRFDTVYDEQHILTYLRLLDADAEGADWRDVARIVLHLDPEREFDRARRAFESHLARAKWMTEHGYRQLLRGDASA
jgi:hypothetical protein